MVTKSVEIQMPEMLTPRERIRDTVFTAIMWGIYLYLWAPLVSLFAWLLGVEFAYDVMIRSGGAAELGDILFTYAIIFTVILGTVTIWSLGNRLRYGKLTRRHALDDLGLVPMAEFFGVDCETVETLRSTQSVSIDFDSDGRPLIERYEGFQ